MKAHQYPKTKLEEDLYYSKYAQHVLRPGIVPEEILQEFKADSNIVKQSEEYQLKIKSNHG